MQEKIDWYQEVVDLEPSSKLFFPLAKMVAETDVARAVETLQRGLERHPEFIEARFFFVELLHKYSAQEDYALRLKTQLSILSPMLTRYAGFWQAWSHNLTNTETTSDRDDKALAAAFLGVMCENTGISLSDIFAAGLQSYVGTSSVSPDSDQDKAPAEPVQEPSAQATPEEAAPEEVALEEVAPASSEPTEKVSKPKPKVTVKSSAKPRLVVRSIERPVAVSSAKAPEQNAKPVVEGEQSADSFSLRTRSMADVLAEQGDYTAALEIYNELIQATEDAQEKEDLQARVAGLTSMPTSSAEASAEVRASSPGKERVISVLESLADRLENRVHS